jgi:hypothetical protein
MAKAARPSPPSPATEKFFSWLAETRYQWYTAANGKIRARAEDIEVCAITGVAQHRAGVAFSIGHWMRAADTIGLSYAEAELIVTAADAAQSSDATVHLLRKRLLIATRIESSPATAPVAPDPGNRALSDFLAACADIDELGRPSVEQSTYKEEELVSV